jgi:hypothetical protein
MMIVSSIGVDSLSDYLIDLFVPSLVMGSVLYFGRQELLPPNWQTPEMIIVYPFNHTVIERD